jgi:sulfide dehydrogenase cytochrome subunit
MLFMGLLGWKQAFSDTTHLACYGCHGPNGVSEAEHIPTIAGLNFQYFYKTMRAFRSDERRSTIMGRIAKGYRTSQLQRMALYFGRQPWTGKVREVDLALAGRGGELHRELCEKCHEQNGHYQDRETPPLAGQARGYLVFQMTDYRRGLDDMPQPALMQERLEKLSDADLMALAEFYASPLTQQQSAPADR